MDNYSVCGVPSPSPSAPPLPEGEAQSATLINLCRRMNGSPSGRAPALAGERVSTLYPAPTGDSAPTDKVPAENPLKTTKDGLREPDGSHNAPNVILFILLLHKTERRRYEKERL